MSDTPLDKGLAKMRVIRRDASFTLKKSSLLHDEIQVPGVGKVPFQLRPYQQQMVFHLLLMPRFVVGEDTGCGKCTTLDTILATRMDGQLMSVRDKGPLFLIYPFDLDSGLYNEKYFARSVWQIKEIEVGE